LNNFTTRTLSGAVFVILVIGSVLLHPYVFVVVFWAIAMLGLHEFLSIVSKDDSKKPGILPYLVGSYGYLTIALVAHHLLIPYNIILVLLTIPLVSLLFIKELYSGNEKPFTRVAKSLLGILYVCIPLALLNFLFYPSLADLKAEKSILISLFCLIWINDTFAYLTGILIGKHLLFPSISPKKTWEGTFGGIIFTLAAGMALAYYFPVLSYFEWFIFTAVIIVFGTFGDLIESMLKRSYQIKDSGNIMPGHGGVLDRFDATLGVAPAAFVMLLIILLL
jgi:phosphatidate cytidylyltransferase